MAAVAIVVVVDTNMIRDSPKLRREEWLSLIENKTAWGVEFAVPEVVVMESVNVVRREWDKQRSALAKVKVGEFGLGETLDSMLTEIDKCSEGYEQWLRDRLGEIGASIVPPPPTDLMDLARRASALRAPYAKDKDGLRDTLIWLTVLAIAQDRPDAEVWFVSDNHDDFGPKPGSWTGENTGERDDCPILFHRDLRDDLDERSLSNRVNYVVSMKRLEQHIAARFAPIPEPDLKALADQIDRKPLAEGLMSAAFGMEVDPEQAALPLAAVAAAIVGNREQDDGWEFSEGARRGKAGWTARFAVDTEVDITFVRHDLTLPNGDVTKKLRLFGDITVSSENEVLDIVVTSAEALPDDPQRARWAERSNRRAAYDKFPDPFRDLPFQSVSAGYASAQNRAFAEEMSRSLPPESLRQIAERAQEMLPPESLRRVAEQAQKALPPEDLRRMAENIRKMLPPEFR